MNTTTNRKTSKFTARACERLISHLVHRAAYSRDGQEIRLLMSRAVTWRTWLSQTIHAAPKGCVGHGPDHSACRR